MATKRSYVIANTSTLPGCEKGTIDFFKTYLPDAIDGILLPRNHDGTLPITKGHAAANVIAHLPPKRPGLISLYIDDSPHHNIAFREQVGMLGNACIATFQPEYPSHLPVDEGSITARTPLQAFRSADQFLNAGIGR